MIPPDAGERAAIGTPTGSAERIVNDVLGPHTDTWARR